MADHDVLRTLAEVATAFAGFTGIVVVLGGRSRESWQPNDTISISVLLASSLGVVFFGFVPDLAMAAHLEPSQAWRVSCFLFASYHLIVIVGSLWGLRQAHARGDPGLLPGPITPLFVAGGFSIVGGQLLAAAGFAESWVFFFYLLGLLWLLAVATVAFARLLMHTIRSKPAG